MKAMTQTDIAKKIGVSKVFVNRLVNSSKRPNWKRAKQLAAVTNTTPELWLEESPEKIKAALNNNPSPLHTQDAS